MKPKTVTDLFFIYILEKDDAGGTVYKFRRDCKGKNEALKTIELATEMYRQTPQVTFKKSNEFSYKFIDVKKLVNKNEIWVQSSNQEYKKVL